MTTFPTNPCPRCRQDRCVCLKVDDLKVGASTSRMWRWMTFVVVPAWRLAIAGYPIGSLAAVLGDSP